MLAELCYFCTQLLLTRLEEIIKMKKTVLSGLMLVLASMAANAQEAKQAKIATYVDASTFAQRFEKFVKDVETKDSLTSADKAKCDSTYHAFLAEYKVVKDSLSDEDVRKVSKVKVKYQKAKVNAFTDKTTEKVSDAANDFGSKVSRAFKKTKKKVEGAIDALKE